MDLVAPNLAALIGEIIGARLISHAGGFRKLFFCPVVGVVFLFVFHFHRVVGGLMFVFWTNSEFDTSPVHVRPNQHTLQKPARRPSQGSPFTLPKTAPHFYCALEAPSLRPSFRTGCFSIRREGSLTNLAKYPASTVQILGAEKALFRALKTKADSSLWGRLGEGGW